MGKLIKISDYQDDPVGYCGECDSDAFQLILDSDDPESASVIGLKCYGCGEFIELAPIVIECTIEKEK